MIDICPYCGSSVSLVGSEIIYGKSYGMIYLCDRYPLCDAYVGTHSNSKKHAPLGRLANAKLRGLKKEVHRWFDPLWRYRYRKTKDADSRKAAYKWLARKLKIKVKKCHVGLFDEDTCKEAIEICKSAYSNKRKIIDYRKNLIGKGEL